MRNKKGSYKGFTFVELLVALIVMGMVFAAIASLTYAFTAANESTTDLDTRQAQIRLATLRLTDLIRNCRLICAQYDAGNWDIVIWRADDNDDNKIQANELVYVERGSSRTYIRFVEIPSSMDVELSWTQSYYYKDWLISKCDCDPKYTPLISGAKEVGYNMFDLDQYGRRVKILSSDSDMIPYAKFIYITFKFEIEGIDYHYQISGALRCWAGDLIDDLLGSGGSGGDD